jgi:hypothetical protein
MSQTVKLHISIYIDQVDDDADTGLTIEQWNAMTDGQRAAKAQQMWNDMAEMDNGGMRVLTEGAVGI